MMKRCVLLLGLVACSKHEARQKPTPETPVVIKCEQQPFAESTTLPEASGAAWLDDHRLVVVSDSGHKGDYVLVDAEKGDTVESGKLPLGMGTDDLEGLAFRDDKLYGLSSNGFMRVWQREKKGFLMLDGPYPIGQGDFVCDVEKTNCAKNYEGLALAPQPSSQCAGFACSKEEGRLYCLTQGADGRYAINPSRFINVEKKDVLADCAFSPSGELYVGNNLFGLSHVYRIDGWQDTQTAKVTPIDALGIGFAEVIAAKGDIIYRMSDTGGTPSLMVKFRCAPSTR